MSSSAVRLLTVVSLLSATAAWAQDPAPESASEEAAPEDPAPVSAVEAPSRGAAESPEASAGKMQLPGQLDLRASFQADLLLAFISLGVAVDFGVLPVGPGTLAVGGEFEVSLCGTFCLAFGALTGTSLSNTYYAPHARVTYHFAPPAKNRRQLEKVDLYALALGGVTHTRTRFTGSGWDYRGSDTGPSFGLGGGAKYFVKERLFLGGEARLRYSAGTYRYSLRVGTVDETGDYDSWSLSGLQLMFFVGGRL